MKTSVRHKHYKEHPDTYLQVSEKQFSWIECDAYRPIVSTVSEISISCRIPRR